MIASIRGRLAEKSASHCVVEAGGIGYQVGVSTQTARALPEPGDPVFLHTHLVVREDAQLLFGFVELEERRLFELLITVSGVGPKVALAVLSGLRPAELARAIRDENLAALVGVPGVGRKTAERLVVDLRDKLEIVTAAAPAPGARGAPQAAGRWDDAVAALVRLGYSQPQATQTVRGVVRDEGELSVEDVVRRALAQLTRQTAGTR
jgi:Holliday junction DNA helicase RuvA